jgi:death-on-curing protein
MTEFLTLDEVLALHSGSIARFGGDPGIKDIGLLESALAMPQASFDGVDLHETLSEKAAAYLFHVVKNHAFVDGNKRTGLAVALVFLELNGFRWEASDSDLIALTLSVASGARSKAAVAVTIAEGLVPLPPPFPPRTTTPK